MMKQMAGIGIGITEAEVLEIALRELCIEKGIFTTEDHRRFTEFAEQIGPTPAAHLVARDCLIGVALPKVGVTSNVISCGTNISCIDPRNEEDTLSATVYANMLPTCPTRKTSSYRWHTR
jgi:hypothetical protein